MKEFCEDNKETLTCGYATEDHDIYEGIARFIKAEGNEKSHLSYFDFGVKNGWHVPNPTAMESSNSFIIQNRVLKTSWKI